MKRFLACLLALTMLLAAYTAAAEDAFTVGSTTKLSGCFFTDMWGSNTADIDVRALLHGYNLMHWDGGEGQYTIDNSVVSGIAVMPGEKGSRTYSISLYRDLTYSDGTPITAWDYAFSMLLSLAPETEQIGGAVNRASYIVGAADYTGGSAKTLSGVRVLDDYRLNVTVESGSVPYFYEMGLLDFSPYPIAVIAPGCEVADDGKGAYIRNADPNAAEPVFTAALLKKTILDPQTGYLSHPSVVSGPYTLTGYDADSGEATFAINPYYKGGESGTKPSIETIAVRNVTNENMFALLESGEVDLINKVTAKASIDAGMRMASEGKALARSYDRSGLSFVSFNCERPAMASQAVRQAIAYCFDKDAFVRGYVGEYGKRVEGWYGMGQWMTQMTSGAANTDASGAALPTLAGVKPYTLNTAQAAKLLDGDGWKLNADGVREKSVNGETVTPALTLICPAGNAAAQLLESTLAANLESAGIALTIEEVPFTELLNIYYRKTARECDMIYLASNFDLVFDPALTFDAEDAAIGRTNRTGIADEKLAKLAADLNRTEPGDVAGYLNKWVAFQARFAEVLPAMPVYSNVYYDFYTKRLQNYDIRMNESWAKAIVGAYLSDF